MTAVPQVDPRDVPAGATIIDVREDYEWEGGHATGAKHITLGTIAERLEELTSAWFAAGLPMTSENGEAPAVVH